jgi:hypothetical protein
LEREKEEIYIERKTDRQTEREKRERERERECGRV